MENDVQILEMALDRIAERDAFVRRLIVGIVGEENANRVLGDETFLPLLRPILRTDGKDAEAVARLRNVFTPVRQS